MTPSVPEQGGSADYDAALDALREATTTKDSAITAWGRLVLAAWRTNAPRHAVADAAGLRRTNLYALVQRLMRENLNPAEK